MPSSHLAKEKCQYKSKFKLMYNVFFRWEVCVALELFSGVCKAMSSILQYFICKCVQERHIHSEYITGDKYTSE